MATSIPISKPPSKPSKSTASQPPPSSKPSSSISSHLAMVELKSRILASLAKLADRDTHQIAVDDLEKIISTLPSDGVPMLINSLTADTPGAPPPTSVRRESLRLLTLLAASHPDATAAHLPKIIAYFVRRLKDPAADSSVRDACREATAALTALYVRPCTEESGGGGGCSVVGLFVKPFLEAMGEQNKAVQAGAAACLAKVVECTGLGSGTGAVFHKLCLRVCKLLDGQNFQAKGSLLAVVSSLGQVGAINPQTMLPLLQCVRECLESNDWFTRKAAADTLCALATHSSHLIGDGAASTISALESCRFDKVKPVRDSMTEALSLWKKFAGKEEVVISEDAKKCESTEAEEKSDNRKSNPSSRRPLESKNASGSSSPTDSDLNSIGRGSIPEKAAVFLKKKVPSLTDKDLNPEFFHKLETRNPDDFPIEVVVSRRVPKTADPHCQEEQELADNDSRGGSSHIGYADCLPNEVGVNGSKLIAPDRVLEHESSQDRWMGQRSFRTRDPKTRSLGNKGQSEVSLNDTSSASINTRADGSTPIDSSFINSKGNWLAIQRQLAQLERQQANIMSMLQDFMGGSHQSMITLENRVRGLERVMVEMARDLAVSSGRKGGGLMLNFEGSPGRPGMFGGFHEYTSSMFGRAIDSRVPLPERFLSNDNTGSGLRGKESSRRSDCEAWDSYPHTPPRNGIVASRRGQNIGNFESRLPRNEPDNGPVGNRRAWDKGQGPFRLGEGPSARSVWQASKDEATLEAIRVAGEDNEISQTTTQVSSRVLDAEALADDNVGPERPPHWDLWIRAMDSLQIGDMDSAYADVLSMEDEILLVKLMERSGPVINQLTKEIAREVLHIAGQFLLEQSLFDIALSWMQQFMELSTKSGLDFLCIPFEMKKEILFNLQEVSSLEIPEDWEGRSPEQMMLQLASIWGVNLQQLFK